VAAAAAAKHALTGHTPTPLTRCFSPATPHTLLPPRDHPRSYAGVFAAHHAGPLLALLKGQKPPGVRAIASGAFAEVTLALGGRAAPLAERLMPALMREIRCDDSINRQNGAYCAGVLAANCTAAMQPYFGPLLQALQPLFSEEEEAGARDNAAGAVARMLAAAPGALPLEAILPVLLGALPLREDMEEGATVYGALCALLLGDQATRVAPLVPRILHILGEALAQPPPAAATPEARTAIGRALNELNARYAAQLGPVVAALPAELRAALTAAAGEAAAAAAAPAAPV